ncbi:hypothetical protein SAMN05660653_00074 [Desulfonatronum thiosulfatophilum]|uniref:Uncharacterized protein n=1 Tax=Desulfonatronum thiosulfatophilum TaxID=617002 RepID=A0A1G6A1E1_9BACT|nr:hypothetical protein [Desulfonatronum thiosulfatophilum]SDB02298.1 hypothetical protein SAMN05660653_00074 [Desulfonatronum thiosulfatophilum]
MKHAFKFGFLILAALLLVGLVGPVQAQTQLRELGRSPFYPVEMNTVSDFQEMVRETLPAIREGFSMMGAPDLVDPFVDQVRQGNVEQTSIPPGQRMQWMMFRTDGRIEIINDLVWAGPQPFNAFQLFVDSGPNRHVFIVPAVCGNITLAQTIQAPAPAPAPTQQPAPAPAPAPTPAPTPPPVDEVQELVTRIPGNFVADLGYMHQPNAANYALFRIGYRYPIHQNISILGMVGFAPVFRGDGDDDSFMIDLLANYHYHRMFFGAGVGFWTSSDNDRFDLIVNTGYRIYGEPNQFNASLFLEARGAVDELDDLRDYGRFGGGLRLEF